MSDTATTPVRRILFLTGTRADYGKLKPLMQAVEASPQFDCRIFATGMHTLEKYGYTVDEVRAGGFEHVYVYANQILGEPMDLVLANTVLGLARHVHDSPPDMIVVHGDRVEALAGAIVGAMRNIHTGHIEGGELSGTVDELIRHSVTKLSHIHFVANEEAAGRLIQMGETREAINIIGSPDIDVMLSSDLPTLDTVKAHYAIGFNDYAIALFHPVTTELAQATQYAEAFAAALVESDTNFVVIYPNNDHGSGAILKAYERLQGQPRFRLLPSMRFEYFLALLKHARFIAGNSSASIREAPVYGVPTINVGTRQNNRFDYKSILNVGYGKADILDGIRKALAMGPQEPSCHFGDGRSRELFMAALESPALWATPKQKRFVDFVPGEQIVPMLSRAG